MFSFNELPKETQLMVVNKSMSKLVDLVISGTVELSLPDRSKNKLMQRILTHARKNENMQLAKTNLLVDQGIRQELLKVCRASIELCAFDSEGNAIKDEWRTV